MKLTYLLSCLLAVLYGASASGQQPSIFEVDETAATPRTFYGGLVAGANFSQVDGDTFAGYHKVGFHAGAQVYVRLLPKLFGSLELLYAQKGSKARYEGTSAYTGTDIEGYDLELNYVEVPVLLHYFYKPRIQFGAGASYSRLLKFDESAFASGPVNIYSDVNYFRKEDFCYMLDGSYEFYKGWLIEFRYARSFLSIRDADRIPQGYGGGIAGGQYNNLCTLRLAWFIR